MPTKSAPQPGRPPHGDVRMVDAGVHMGETFMTYSNTYPSLAQTVAEGVQNALDAGAPTIFIGVDLPKRSIIVCDNGEGVTEERFNEALLTVGKGIKKPGSIGRFGLGLISPLAKCRLFEFWSQPAGSPVVNVWTFEQEKIKAQKAVQIPLTTRPTFSPNPAAPFIRLAGLPMINGWRTMVRLNEITQDRTIGIASLNDVESIIRGRFSAAMRRLGTTVLAVLIAADGSVEWRTIDPHEFRGERLDIVTIEDSVCGRVTFELFKARRGDSGQREGEVWVRSKEDPDNPIPVKGKFSTQLMGTQWQQIDSIKEAISALRSGYFEGMITVEHLELGKSRDLFVANDLLTNFYFVVDTWFSRYGSNLLENEREALREERHARLGQRSLERLRELFRKNSDLADLARFLPSQEDALAATKRREEATPKTGTSSKRRKVVGPRPERRPHDPRRGFPLRYAHEALASDRLWEYSHDECILTFNIRHPTWVLMDETKGEHTTEHDRRIMHLQEWLTLELLVALSLELDLEITRAPIDLKAGPYAELIIIPSASRSRKRAGDETE
ncbi:MAG TPA: ATP-binding protein [Candidatus Saccharimonadales bacterium]|nr:ATP-binding protein [Candidatus Saccharimonadales bacterium]